MGRVLKGVAVVAGLFFSGLLFLSARVEAVTCYSSTGGNGTTWLAGQVLAGSTGVADVAVYLQPTTWTSGYANIYESDCTDNSGNFSFKTETSPSTACYSSYTYSGTTTTYCNWRSAQCYQQCYSDNTNGYYTGMSVDLTGYKLVTYLPYDSSISKNYGNGTSSSFDINFSSSQTVNITLPSKDEILRIYIQDEDGAYVKSDLSLSVSGPDYTYQSLNGVKDYTDIYVRAGDYYVGAYCTNWQSCSYGCVGSTSVKVSSGDGIKSITLKAKKNNATVSGKVSGSNGVALSNAYVSVSNYDYEAGSNACSGYGYKSTDGSGNYSISVPEGTYTMWVSPPYTYSAGSAGSSYASFSGEVKVSKNETTTKNVTLLSRDSSISGTCKDSNGTALQNCWVYASNYSENQDGTNDWANGSSDSSGAYSFSALKGKKYNVQASYWNSSSSTNSSDVSNCATEGMLTVTSPATGVNFTFAAFNSTVNFNLVDSDGNALSSVQGGANIRLQNSSSDANYCGSWVNFDSGRATKKLKAGTAYVLEPYTWGATTYDPQAATTTFTAPSAGETSNVNITMVPVGAKITGQLKDEAGNAIAIDNFNYVHIDCTKGSIWRNCSMDDTDSYTCNVSAGKWCCGYWVDWNSNYASVSSGSSNKCIDVTAGATHTYNLTLLKKGTIACTVTDQNGNPKKWVWCEALPYSAEDSGGDSSKRMYWGNGCSTNASGKCNISVGASAGGTKYYVNASRPWNEMKTDNETRPEEKEVTVTPGETKAAVVKFRALDGEIQITASASSSATSSISLSSGLPEPTIINANTSIAAAVSASDIVSEAFVSGFSELGGYSEATTDSNGVATLKCSSGDVWHFFCVNQVENNLYMSEDAEVTCNQTSSSSENSGISFATVTANCVMDKVGTIPDSKSETWNNGESGKALTLDDGFSISFQASALGSGNVTCSVEPDPLLPYQAGKRPANRYGYDITCTDANGSAITSFNSDATICLPISDSQLSTLKLSAADLDLVYNNTATGSYTTLSSVTIDDDNNTVCGTTNHLTEFTIVGNGSLSGADGDDGTAETECSGSTCTGSAAGGGGTSCSFVGVGRANGLAVIPFLLLVFMLSIRRHAECRACHKK